MREINFKVRDRFSDWHCMTLKASTLYYIQRRDNVIYNKWNSLQVWGEEVKVHDKVWHEEEWKKVMRIEPTEFELALGQGRN